MRAPAPAPRSPYRRLGPGYTVTAPGLFVWEECRRDAMEWQRELAAMTRDPGIVPDEIRLEDHARGDADTV